MPLMGAYTRKFNLEICA
uniref:Uncharacterized protein n=1 Tax=Rhizophora mucronata TaxID=61149 RepID=A0A2P2Q6N9_RHIMU